MTLVNFTYFLVASVVSVFYGVRAHLLTKAPLFERWHQTWFNFAGSALGWAAGYWILLRFADRQAQIEVADLLLVVFAALGIVGHLPQTLIAIPGLLINLSQLAKKKFESQPNSDSQKPDATT